MPTDSGPLKETRRGVLLVQPSNSGRDASRGGSEMKGLAQTYGKERAVYDSMAAAAELLHLA